MSDFFSGVESILSARRSDRPAWMPVRLVQACLDVKTLSDENLGTFLACCARFLRKLANVDDEGIIGGRIWGF
jgi:hypothetical protein